jgi:hypothetical protein
MMECIVKELHYMKLLILNFDLLYVSHAPLVVDSASGRKLPEC